MKFVILRDGDEYRAWLFGAPGTFGSGSTEEEALGKLVQKVCTMRGTGWTVERRGES